MTKCYVCRRHMDKSEAIYVDPATAKVAKKGVPFCSECVPAQ
jgi:hypothetical protein